jgi:hypothetical protein
MNASRRFPPNSACQWVSTPSPAPVSISRLLAGADWMKKFDLGHRHPRHLAIVYQRLDHLSQGRAQPAQHTDVRQVPARQADSLQPPPGLCAVIRRQQAVTGRRSGRRDGIDEIHGDYRLADQREAAAASRAGRPS